jgi:hypothetical protein
MNPLKNFFPRLFTLARRHLILTTCLVLACLAFAFFGFWIGFVQIVVLLVPVSLFAWVLIARRIEKQGETGGMSEAIAVCSYIALASVATFALIQAVPYGHNHTNPSNYNRQYEPSWDSTATRDLVVRACYGCHSNEVKYPSYSKIAPISWMVASHIDEGRGALNFSTVNKYSSSDVNRMLGRAIHVIQEGSMPPSYYTHFGKHPEAKLTAAEKEQLVAGLSATASK